MSEEVNQRVQEVAFYRINPWRPGASLFVLLKRRVFRSLTMFALNKFVFIL